MYTEFIIIYVLLIVLIALSVVNLIFAIKGKSNSSSKGFAAPSFNNQQQQFKPSPVDTPVQSTASPAFNPNQGSSVVFCLNCATQYSSNDKCCPNCGTPRS